MKTKIKIMIVVIGFITLLACQKTNTPIVKANQEQVNPEQITANVKKFISDAKSNTHPVEYYTLKDAVFIIEASVNYLFDSNEFIENREFVSYPYKIDVKIINQHKTISSEELYAIFNDISRNLMEQKHKIMVVDVEEEGGQLVFKVMYCAEEKQTDRVMNNCNPFAANSSYPLIIMSTSPSSAHKALELKLDAYCALNAPCPLNYSYYFTNVQSALFLPPSSGLWQLSGGACVNISTPLGSLSGSTLNTYKTSAVNCATANQPPNTDTKIDYNITHELLPCTYPNGQQKWFMSVQYGLRVCYLDIPND